MKPPHKILEIGFSSLLFLLIISAKNHTSVIIKEEKFQSIQTLINGHQLEAQIKGIGGYQKECIAFNLINLTADTLSILLESGRRLTSFDSTIQDILIVKSKKIKLDPYQQETVTGYGFCCQSKNGGPKKDSEFNIGYMAPPEWQILTKVIDENKFPTHAIQSAIWVLSNDHALSSIHHEDLDEIQSLRRTVADIKGIKLPWYTLIYEEDTTMLFSTKPDQLISDMSYYLKTNATVSINIRNALGELVYNVANIVNPGRGSHSFHLRLPVKNWPKGEYGLYIYEDYNNLNTKKIFVL
jgi:hypothetical protein